MRDSILFEDRAAQGAAAARMRALAEGAAALQPAVSDRQKLTSRYGLGCRVLCEGAESFPVSYTPPRDKTLR